MTCLPLPSGANWFDWTAEDERLTEMGGRQREKKGSSNRAFGLTIAVVLIIIAAAPLRHGDPIRWQFLAAAAVLLIAALLFPVVLGPFNKVWLKFGHLLSRVMNPLIMGILFFLVVTPISLAMRLAGKNTLGVKPDLKARTYWVNREPPVDGNGMVNQF